MRLSLKKRSWLLGILAVLAVVLLGSLLALGYGMVMMPGSSHEGPLPELTPSQQQLADQLMSHVTYLADQLGPRHMERYDTLQQAANYIESQWQTAGLAVHRQRYLVNHQPVDNLQVEFPGSRHPEQIVVIGAHYDTVPGSPGANDNASGIAAILALGSMLSDWQPARTVRLVAFANEEQPWHRHGLMGSQVYARHSRRLDERIVAMISLDGIGYYRHDPQTQHYPEPFNLLYPSTGNFIGFVGDLGSMSLLRRSVQAFRQHADFPSQGAALPRRVADISRSDHASFWHENYPAILITDTLPFRDPHYHQPGDTADRLDYTAMARVVEGIAGVARELGE